VASWLTAQHRKAGHPETGFGSVTFAERFGSALEPPPRVNLVRYHGVLPPNAKDLMLWQTVLAFPKDAGNPHFGMDTN
jgi:hypothetical protein